MDNQLENADNIKKYIEEIKKCSASIVDTVRDPLLVLDADLRVVCASRSFYQIFEVTQEETEGQLIYDLGDNQWDIPKLRELLEKILPKKTAFNDFEVEHDFEKVGKRIMYLNARQIFLESTSRQLILLAIEDVTERRKTEKELKKRTKELQSIVNSMAGREIRMVELKGVIEKLHSQLEEAGITPVANDPWTEI